MRSDTVWLLRPQPWWLCREVCAGASRGCFSWIVLETDLRQGVVQVVIWKRVGRKVGQLVEDAGSNSEEDGEFGDSDNSHLTLKLISFVQRQLTIS